MLCVRYGWPVVLTRFGGFQTVFFFFVFPRKIGGTRVRAGYPAIHPFFFHAVIRCRSCFHDRKQSDDPTPTKKPLKISPANNTTGRKRYTSACANVSKSAEWHLASKSSWPKTDAHNFTLRNSREKTSSSQFRNLGVYH